MAELVEPSLSPAASFRAAMAAFQAEGRGRPDDDTAIGHELREFAHRWHTDAGLAEFIEALRRAADPAVQPKSGWVHVSTYWWVAGDQLDQYLGSIRIRHQLNDRLLEIGGHIGYDVAPAARRQGHGTAMLAAMLTRAAAELGLDSVLVTCDADNIGSRKIIETNGGKLEDEREGKLRFWVPTA